MRTSTKFLIKVTGSNPIVFKVFFFIIEVHIFSNILFCFFFFYYSMVFLNCETVTLIQHLLWAGFCVFHVFSDVSALCRYYYRIAIVCTVPIRIRFQSIISVFPETSYIFKAYAKWYHFIKAWNLRFRPHLKRYFCNIKWPEYTDKNLCFI